LGNCVTALSSALSSSQNVIFFSYHSPLNNMCHWYIIV
jgi:hypothetical protein